MPRRNKRILKYKKKQNKMIKKDKYTINMAKRGYANAQYNLGYMYSYGKGVKQNYSEAVKWYRLAAEQGNAKTQSNLNYMYEHGEGVCKTTLEQ